MNDLKQSTEEELTQMNARTDQDLLPALSMNATKDVLINDLTHHPEQAQYLSTAMLQLR